MNKGLIFAAGLIIGAVAGAFGMFKYIKRLEDKDEEVLETYDVSDILTKEKREEIEEAINNSSYAKYCEKVKSTTGQNNDISEDAPDKKIIPPEELGEEFGSDSIITLYWTRDDFLVDEYGEEVEIEASVGQEAITDISAAFHGFSDDSVCVRNYTRQTDYEILYSDKDVEEMKSKYAGNGS